MLTIQNGSSLKYHDLSTFWNTNDRDINEMSNFKKKENFGLKHHTILISTAQKKIGKIP